MKMMKPKAIDSFPNDASNFFYEIKYDGFRTRLIWEKDTIQIMSRNNIRLTNRFPEIIAFCEQMSEKIIKYLPIILDGELAVLNNEFEANFELIQRRGRLKNDENIRFAAKERPASFLAFDLLTYKGEDITDLSYEERRKVLNHIIAPMTSILGHHVIHSVEVYKNRETLWRTIRNYRCEGVVAKRKNSKYVDGKEHHDWFKIKNWRTIQCFIKSYNPNNGYFSVGVYSQDKVVRVGSCKHGLRDEEFETLKKLFLKNGKRVADNDYELPPAVCTEIHTLDLYEQELREPRFARLRPNLQPKHCTYEKMQMDLAMMPKSVLLSNTEKIYWPHISLTKGDLLVYLRLIFPYIIPFLLDRNLTIIRCPDGVDHDFFYQKSLPAYAPTFMKSMDKDTIVCNKMEALIWLANHGAVEYHVPFQPQGQDYPTEIVFDLDPPDQRQFQVAVEAALLIKRLIDHFGLRSFVKTSGNKGLQIHIPLPDQSMSYDDTSVFTEAVAKTIVQQYPYKFTIERRKEKRENRLYIDYVQHGKGKTIIAPYSPRKTKNATVATPLFWHELTDELTPNLFTIKNMIQRVKTIGCPFAYYKQAGNKQNMERLLKYIRS